MKSHEPTPAADQGICRDAAEQLPANWNAHVVDFDAPSFLEYNRVGVAEPVAVTARWAFEPCARALQRSYSALKVVLSSVAFHR